MAAKIACSKMGNDAPVEIRIGPHLFRWEPPDTAFLAFVGDLDGKSMVALSHEARKFTVGKPRVFNIVDLSKTGSISADARKATANTSKDVAFCGVAIIGASPALRVISTLVGRAVDLLNGNVDNPTRFFATEAEARAWIKERRQKLSSK